jgi:hypothetical protein
MPEYADRDDALAIADKLSVRWASLLDRLSDYDGPKLGEADA